MKLKITIEKNKQNIFFTSDPHFGHKNIVRGTSSWTDQTRDFNTVEEHDSFLIDRLNERVKCNDILFILGDFTFKGYHTKDYTEVKNYRNRINCKNIYFVYGNHDEVIEKNKDLQDMFKGVSYYFNLTIKITEHNTPTLKYKFDLSHYSKRTWAGLYSGVIMLYGHSHNMLEEYVDKSGKHLKTMDVGVDTKKDFSPYSLKEILSIMESKDSPDLDSRINGVEKNIKNTLKSFFIKIINRIFA